MQKRTVFNLDASLVADAKRLAEDIDSSTSQVIKDILREATENYEALRRKPFDLDGQSWATEKKRVAIMMDGDKLERAKIVAKQCEVSLTHFLQCALEESLTKKLQEREARRRYIREQRLST